MTFQVCEPLADNFESSAEWIKWLSAERQTSLNVYKSDPNRLIADYRSEQSISRDYEGREVLELLQNANDAAARQAVEGKVYIQLLPEGLIVANTGSFFSTGGVRSFRLPHLSPKKGSKIVIGNKGLGVRAVLNWARYPIILSGALQIAYSQKNLAQIFKDLLGLAPDFKRLIESEKLSENELTIPVLAFPGFSNSGDLSHILDSDASVRIYSRCKSLTAEYQTVIGMPFDHPRSFEKANKQIRLLGPEVMLFVNNLSELRIDVSGSDPVHWIKNNSKADEVRIYDCTDTSRNTSWRVFPTSGEVPKTLLKDPLQEKLNYEITLAIPQSSAAPGVLFSHFKTEVRFPYPIACHLSIELQANRQHPQESEINGYIFERLADHMCSVAEGLAVPEMWNRIKLLARTSELDHTLAKFRFEEALIRAARKSVILPTFSGELIRPEDAKRVRLKDGSWLPLETFGDIVAVPPTQVLSQFVEVMKLTELTEVEWRLRIQGIKFDSVQSRARFIAGLVNEGVLPKNPVPELLIDECSRAISCSHRIYLPPIDAPGFEIPEWLNLRFLHAELRDALLSISQCRDQRALQHWLNDFQISEYSTSSLISALINESNKRIQIQPANESNILNNLLSLIFRIFTQARARGEQPSFPADSSLRILNQTGKFESSRSLYLGRGYPPHGEVLQSLYEQFAPERLAAFPENLKLAASACLIAEFLSWVGVSRLPRDISDKTPADAFFKYCIYQLKYPLQFEDKTYDAPESLLSAEIVYVTSIDSLSEILKHAPAEAVLAWLAIDERANSWRMLAPLRGAVRCRPHKAHKTRTYIGDLPSYARWMIRTTKWLLLFNERKEAPANCLSGERGLDRLFPKPIINVDKFTSYGLHASQINEALDRAGILRNLEFLEYDQVYQMLLEMPDRDPEGASAKSFYQRLLDYSDTFSGSRSKMEEFNKNGKMWGRFDEVQAYFSVSELRHVDFEGVPESLLRHLKIADLKYRIGNNKVQGLFGIKPVEKAEISKNLTSYHSTVFTNQIRQEFESIKPFLIALRRSSSSQTTDLNSFKKLKIEICSEIYGSISFEGKSEPLRLRAWEWILVEDVVYIQEDPAVDSISLEFWPLANALGEICASVFRLENGTDFARIIECPKAYRDRYIPKLLGEKGKAILDELQKDFVSIGNVAPIYELPASALTPNENSTSAPVSPPTTSMRVITPPIAKEIKSTNQNIEITPQVHYPSPPVERVLLRIHRSNSSVGRMFTVGSMREITDSDFCEKKSMEFELNHNPKRYPLLVSQLRGYAAFGCDVLSFQSREDRERFLADPNGNRSLILRYIEVKGRSAQGARIQLKGNELNAACGEFAAKFFIYRFYEKERGEFHLAILQEPLRETSAVRKILEVNLEAAERTEEFVLKGGVSAEFSKSWDGQELPNSELTN